MKTLIVYLSNPSDYSQELVTLALMIAAAVFWLRRYQSKVSSEQNL